MAVAYGFHSRCVYLKIAFEYELISRSSFASCESSVASRRAYSRAAGSVVSAVVTNALGGWISHLHGATRDRAPLPFQRLLVGVALYVPSTLADYRADLASGFDTIAVRLGVRRAYALGYVAWIGAAACSVGLAATGTMIPRHMLPFEAVMVPALVVAYHGLLRRAQTFARITAVAVLFLVPSGVFALTYAGVLG